MFGVEHPLMVHEVGRALGRVASIMCFCVFSLWERTEIIHCFRNSFRHASATTAPASATNISHIKPSASFRGGAGSVSSLAAGWSPVAGSAPSTFALLCSSASLSSSALLLCSSAVLLFSPVLLVSDFLLCCACLLPLLCGACLLSLGAFLESLGTTPPKCHSGNKAVSMTNYV